MIFNGKRMVVYGNFDGASMVAVSATDLDDLQSTSTLVPHNLYLITDNTEIGNARGYNKGDIFLATSLNTYEWKMNIMGEKGDVGDSLAVIFDYGVPDDAIEGKKGTFYFDKYEGDLYLCYDVGAFGETMWEKISVDEDAIVQRVIDALPIYGGETEEVVADE